MKRKFSIFLLCLIFVAVRSAHWAVLVAGSNGWYNYRHQADVCHAFQVLRRHGIPESNIVVMIFDDIAQNKLNPSKGKIFNRPNGEDVYQSVPRDYVGKNVTPKNFLNVLLGNKTALQSIGSGKVLQSGPDDNVFIFFSDHGAPGLVAFPHGVLYATDLNKTITKMYEEKKYKQMVFYLEACESGSMFEKILSQKINVYASTASNSEESSYACYYDERLGTYLGDVFSVNWMENSDSKEIKKETLFEQISIVRQETNTSHVMEYGDVFLAKNETVAEFQGEDQTIVKEKLTSKFDAVPSRYARLASIVQRLLIDGRNEQIKKYFYEQNKIFQRIEQILQLILSKAERKSIDDRTISMENYSCYRAVTERLDEKCFQLQNEFVLSKLNLFVKVCESKIDESILFSAIDEICCERLEFF